MQIQFATNSYQSRALPISAQRTVNFYSEHQPQDTKTPVAVFGVPGLVQFANLPTGPIRGLWSLNGLLYAVGGQTLYSVSSTGVVTAVGGAIQGTGIVSMSDNGESGKQLIIVNGTMGYIYSVAGGFQLITDANFQAANRVTFFDDYFVLDWKGTNKVFISALLDGTTYPALGFQSAEVDPDLVLAVVNQQENLLIFGQKTVETWFDSGAVNFPFQRVDGATIQRGTAAAFTPIKEDNSVFFLGDDLIFYRLDGIFIRRVSTHALEHAWQAYPVVSDAFTFSYTYEGHKFIVLTFPTENATWVHDVATGLWHERESFDMNYNSLGRWRGNCFYNAYNKLLVGDAFSGNIGVLDSNVYTEFDNPIIGTLVSPPLHSDRKRVFMSRFELDMEAGTGNDNSPGDDPQVMMDWSGDGGHTFNIPQKWNALGKLGQYRQRLRWLRMGQARQRVIRVSISDPVKRTIIAASGDIEVGMD